MVLGIIRFCYHHKPGIAGVEELGQIVGQIVGLGGGKNISPNILIAKSRAYSPVLLAIPFKNSPTICSANFSGKRRYGQEVSSKPVTK